MYIIALNTLDLLKKGTSAVAQKARAASRILEAQVGTNPRIRVQRDDAFLLWDSIEFTEPNDSAAKRPSSPAPAPCPEWVRRIICCARWEVDHVAEELTTTPPACPPTKEPRVVLAVLGGVPTLSPNDEVPLTPVPLPAPSAAHAGRYEQRAQGTLVSGWAARAGIECLQIDPALPGRGVGGDHTEEDKERDRERTNQKRGGHGGPQGGLGRGRRPSGSEPHIHGHGGRTGLVERPPAVMAMMEMVAQPSKVVRVLARGEKLDPDP